MQDCMKHRAHDIDLNHKIAKNRKEEQSKRVKEIQIFAINIDERTKSQYQWKLLAYHVSNFCDFVIKKHQDT